MGDKSAVKTEAMSFVESNYQPVSIRRKFLSHIQFWPIKKLANEKVWPTKKLQDQTNCFNLYGISSVEFRLRFCLHIFRKVVIPMQTRPLVCNACNKSLDPNTQTVIYLGWGTRLDGSPGPEIVLALCATTLEQLGCGTNSPCVATALRLLTAAKITPVPATYDNWLASALPQTIATKQPKKTDPLHARQEPEFS